MSKSKFIQLNSTKLSDYFEVRSNRVLEIDDISSDFSNVNSERIDYRSISDINSTYNFNRFLIQTVGTLTNEYQATEVLTLNDSENIVTVIKNSITPTGPEGVFANIEGKIDEFGNVYLEFLPDDSYNNDYEIKILNNKFLTRQSGINSLAVGFVDLLAFNDNVSSGLTTSVISRNVNDYEALHFCVNLIDTTTEDKYYVELYLFQNGTDTYLAEANFDDIDGLTREIIGNFSANITGSTLNLNYTNTGPNQVSIRCRNVGFGNTSIGNGTYRFLAESQPQSSEKSATYTSISSIGTGTNPIDVVVLDRNTFTTIKSLVYVSNAGEQTIHQLLTIHNDINIHVSQQAFMANDAAAGIGTFGGVYSGSDLIIRFYPDPGTSGTVKVSTFNENIYTEYDSNNIPEDLEYYPNSESFSAVNYFGFISENYNRVNFDLNHKGIPIFEKVFNPTSNQLNPITGVFNIPDHFFNNIERLIYTPNSTFDGVSPSALGIGQTLDSDGNLTTTLPEEVYVIKINKDQFRLSTRQDYAELGIGVTFTSLGQGNAHELEMFKKNEKSLILINGMIQYPLLYTPIVCNLNQNIGTGTTIFSLTDIEDIRIKDLLKIDDEYMLVQNVGVGSTNTGPISFIGTIPLVEVNRGVVGSIETSHGIGTSARVYRGSYNIVDSEIYFTEPPTGSAFFTNQLNSSNLLRSRDAFDGRVFLRSDYSTNDVYDDFSSSFTGFGSTFTITRQSDNIVGLGTTGGNGLLAINGIFQSPSTENNLNNNFEIVEDTISGISSVVFTGITDENGDIIISEFDVNQNQLPRGGLLVSVGSSAGIGYAPLVGVAVSAVVSGGAIVGITTSTNFGTWGSGYRSPVAVAVTEFGHTGTVADIDAVVGAGGSLSFVINNGGSGYSTPQIVVPPPTYDNLEVIGVSRLGVGQTTETGIGLLVDIEIGPSLSGIGQSYFEVSSFNITRRGYGFKRGDVIKPVGLVTATGLPSPIQEFTLTVTETFNDNVGIWNIGNLNYIDSIKNLQNGTKTRFPLLYNSELLSFEKNFLDPESQLIDMNYLLLIFINGILQTPGESYTFTGGTSFDFIEPPSADDNISIFFYTGVSGVDSILVDVNAMIKSGDTVQLLQSDDPELIPETVKEDSRFIVEISNSSTVETSLYSNQGIDFINFRPLKWFKQKRDLIINNENVSKSRDSLEAQIYPTAKIIKNVSPGDTEIFVDSIDLFEYDNDPVQGFSVVMVDDGKQIISAGVTAIVSAAGTVTSLSITSPGFGYTGSSVEVSFASPYYAPTGTGVTALATLTVANSQVSLPATIINPGVGYSQSNPPQAIISTPNYKYEDILDISSINGATVPIIEIGNGAGIGVPRSLQFKLSQVGGYDEPQVGYHVYVSTTTIGTGITSINTGNSDIIGIGTVGVDCVYYVNAYNSGTKVVTCNILSTTDVSGLSIVGTESSPVGTLSWGRLSSFVRPSPTSLTVKGNNVSGLSTYPTIQRRGFGLRNTGSIKKSL